MEVSTCEQYVLAELAYYKRVYEEMVEDNEELAERCKMLEANLKALLDKGGDGQ